MLRICFRVTGRISVMVLGLDLGLFILYSSLSNKFCLCMKFKKKKKKTRKEKKKKKKTHNLFALLLQTLMNVWMNLLHVQLTLNVSIFMVHTCVHANKVTMEMVLKVVVVQVSGVVMLTFFFFDQPRSFL